MDLYLAYFRLRSVRTAALLYFIIACLFAMVPLFNYLGFEFAAAFSVPAALISGYLTLSFLADHRRKPLTQRTWLYVAGDYLLVNGILLLVPLVVLSLNAFVVKNCSLAEGLLYYILIPVCTVILAIAWALCSGTLFRNPRTAFVLGILAVLALIPLETYFGPRVAAYNFILGYFPGVTYDESVVDLSRLALYREFTLVLALLLFIVFFLLHGRIRSEEPFAQRFRGLRFGRRDRGLFIAGGICFAVLLAGHFSRSSLGFAESDGDIREALGGTIVSPHFILHVPAERLKPEEIRLMRDEAEFEYATVSARLDVALPPGAKIRIFVYPDGAAKRFFIGTATTNIAKPWRREIHLTLDSFEPTLRHELTHVLAAGFGRPVIDASISMGLNEGLATAVAWDNEDATPHQYAAALAQDGLLGDPVRLFGLTGFASQPGPYAYEVSGSFTKYLIDRYGIGAFKEVYAGASFPGVYGESMTTLMTEWRAFLRTVDIADLTAEGVKTRFLQPAIFHKTCPRVTAERNANAVKAVRDGRYDAAEAQFAAAYDEAPTAGSLCGYYQALLLEGKAPEVTRSYRELDPRSMLAYHPAVLLIDADALCYSGYLRDALHQYNAVTGMHFSEEFSEAAALRRKLMLDLRSPGVLLKYWYGMMPDSTRLALAEKLDVTERTAGTSYLRAAEEERTGRLHDAAVRWEHLLPDLDDRVLAFGAARRAANAYFHTGEFERAAAMYWQAMNFTDSEAWHTILGESIERCAFIENERSEP